VTTDSAKKACIFYNGELKNSAGVKRVASNCDLLIAVDGGVRLHIFEKYIDALKGLDGFSHVFVLYWFDRNDTREKRSILQVHPRGNKKNPLTGVFACRAPVRPNLIALSLCKIISVKDGIVDINNIDALNNSPVLDLKPYIPPIDHITKDVRVPDWLQE